MAFAIFYEPTDMDVLELYVRTNASLLPQSDRQLCLAYWNGGLKDWKVALLGQSPFEEVNPNNKARVIVISGNGLTLQGFRDLLYRIAATIPGASYLVALANDMGNNCGAVEPWPVV